MSNYTIINGQFYELDDALMHYGVAGMKWGVRKALKYQSADRIKKMQRKYNKYTSKADKYEASARKHLSKGRDTFGNNLLRGKGFVKQHRQKAERRIANSTHWRMKAEKVQSKLEKEAAYVEKMKQKVQSLPKSDIDAGYDFCKDLFK